MKKKIVILTLFLILVVSSAVIYENHDISPLKNDPNSSAIPQVISENGARPGLTQDASASNLASAKSAIICETAPEIPAQIYRKADIECAPAEKPDSLADTETSSGHDIAAAPLTTNNDNIISGIVEKGDTISKIITNFSDDDAGNFISAMRKVFSPGSLKTGQPYTLITDPDSGRLLRFEYEINASRRLVVEGNKKPRARLEDIKYHTVLETCAGVIEDNLFQAMNDAGETPQLAVQLAKLFGSEINFVKDLQEGDSFAVLLEKRYRNGHYAGYGRILAARFTNRGKTWEAFLFPDNAGNPHYYNAKGENLKKTLLQAPLAITRLTSKFSRNRKHPLLGIHRPHLGVDYGAPTGTPVKAVGDGVVTKRGWNGGYGNQIIIKHIGGLESLYAHLHKFANGLKIGQMVRQGQVIGYVGSTGLSTGPHLDFRIRQNGAFIDPTKAINPRGAPVSPRLAAVFTKTVKQEQDYLNGHRLPREYVIDMLVPSNVANVIIEDKAPVSPRTKKQRQPARGKHHKRS